VIFTEVSVEGEASVNDRGSLVESSEVREETLSEREEVLERVLRQRERHLERSVFARAGVVVAGGTISVFAALLTAIAPEVGLPLLLLGLRLLALEFDWAARAYARVARLARGVEGRLRKLLPRSKRGVVLTVVVTAAVVALPIGVALL
jgi:hypothetical protein